MVSHILIYNTTCDVDSFVVIDFLNDFAKALESFLKFIYSMVHQAKMESTTDEIFLKGQSLLVHINSLIN